MPFQGLEKGIVLQDVRMFSSPKLKTRECYYLLTKILYLITAKGDSFTPDEATNVFISVTKLFQSKDVALRRMMYLLLKELSHLAEDTIIAFATLIKDVNSDAEMNRANAIRVISGIMDATMLGQMERYLKQAIVDKEPYVASSALVAGIHLADQSLDIIKKWITEIQEALNSRSIMVQYHALGLLHKIKRKDRLAVTKLVTWLADSGSLRSQYAHCLLIRFAVEVMEESGEKDEKLFHYLETCLRHKSDIVVYEAARAICGLKNLKTSDLLPAVAVLQIFLGFPKATMRFAAVRTLNKVATTHPDAIAGSCAFEMENLISDTNRSVATLAITTLLKVEHEGSVERLMKQITNFINDISDEFKIVVVDAIRTLAMKYPDKHYSIMNFLSTMLRDEGGFEFKSSIVTTILNIIEKVPQSTDLALDHLCEFIEDCEYTNLSTKILHLLGKQGPKCSNPSRYIRYIYNRIALENPTVRASAVTALAKFGIHRQELRDKIKVLLLRSLQDSDDEVRDRATFYIKILESHSDDPTHTPPLPPLAATLVVDDLAVPLENLQSDLVAYIENPSEAPFNLGSVSLKVKSPPPSESQANDKKNTQKQAPKKPSALPSFAQHLATIPAIANLGDLLNTSPSIDLTETDGVSAAYHVKLVKHVFPRHIVFHYNVVNTVAEQVLRNVTVEIGSDEDNGFVVEEIIPATEAVYNEPADLFVILSRPPVRPNGPKTVKIPTGNFWNNLLFQLHEIEPKTDQIDETGFPDEFPLDEVEIIMADYIRKNPIDDFTTAWAKTEHEPQSLTTFSLSTAANLKEGVAEIIRLLGMSACDNSGDVAPNATKHVLYLSGQFVAGADTGLPLIGRVRMRYSPQQGVGMELIIRSPNEAVAETIANVMFN
uniref:Coatomer subunit gamma n=1 Tax=Arcella intermedia TaxID=1963864 RepID=A0A6B2KXP1_9EUKA